MAQEIPSYGNEGFRASKYQPEDSCVMCNKHPANTCNQCRSIWYCSKACQEKDWPSHKLLCKLFANQEPRPSEFHRRAIFFPVDEDKPRMIWLLCERNEDEERGPWESTNAKSYIGDVSKGTSRIDYNPITRRRLGSGFRAWMRREGYSIAMIYRDAFGIDGSAINRSILRSVSRSNEAPAIAWSGPLVAVRELQANWSLHPVHEDVDLGDFRHIVDFFITYYR
ncbi:hypothetical protein TWF730_004987 [Orbilia blumenaviensis]|uniref:MYND-type domain-containing protein n=1 Tax=Orbilia blumenaviensis TaxID=1796055 RepID=A0AAV9VGW6_9PEZI